MSTETKWLDVPDEDGLWVSMYNCTMSKPRWHRAKDIESVSGIKYTRIHYETPDPPKREFEPITIKPPAHPLWGMRVEVREGLIRLFARGRYIQACPQHVRELVQAIESACTFLEENQ